MNILRREHRIIDDGLTVLAATASRLDRGAAVPPALPGRLVAFFEAFGGCHHAKEEAALFPILRARCGSEATDQLAVQHRLARERLHRMRCALRPLGDGAVDRYAFAAAAAAYATGLREHIEAEERYLDRVVAFLTLEEDLRLADRFDEIDMETIGLVGVAHNAAAKLAADLLAEVSTW